MPSLGGASDAQKGQPAGTLGRMVAAAEQGSQGSGLRLRRRLLYYMVELHQQRPELFSVGTVLGLYSLRRSMRRGAILETVGRVDNFIVKLMNRWRKKEGARGSEAGLCMRQAYTQMRSMVMQLLLYSKAL